ncbi:acyl-CoA dehydrogenase family protein [Aquabacterium sp.]|uniref:acyl-CoA dehydrogenase family protein n=1 Tax=Aquabacterium sp. TaxID=1872578 RepID=UPI0037839822
MNTATLIADTAERLFAAQVDKATRERSERGEFDTGLWQQVAELGLPRLLATEASGGFGQPWRHAFAVLRGIGFWQVPLPLAETMLAQLLGSLAGFDLPEGPLTVLQQGRGNTLHMDVSNGRAVLGGEAHGVPWARDARAAVLSLNDGRIAWLRLAPGGALRITPQANLAGLPADTLHFDGLPIEALADNPLPLHEPVWTLGALARSAMLVGALESALAMAVQYAGERVQFGKPIGRNQALQQQLALMAGDVAAARMAAQVAADGAPAEPDDSALTTRFDVAVAKVRAGEAATRGTAIAHQVHGAIGFTQAHALHFATRRLWAWRAEFGTDAQWAAELGRAAIAARGAGFWPALTQRHF